jgi:hypothetical protein
VANKTQRPRDAAEASSAAWRMVERQRANLQPVRAGGGRPKRRRRRRRHLAAADGERRLQGGNEVLFQNSDTL